MKRFTSAGEKDDGWPRLRSTDAGRRSRVLEPIGGFGQKLVKDQGPALVFADHKVSLLQQLVAERQGLDAYFDKPLIIGLRPSSLEDAAFVSGDDRPRIKGEVAVTEELGSPRPTRGVGQQPQGCLATGPDAWRKERKTR